MKMINKIPRKKGNRLRTKKWMNLMTSNKFAIKRISVILLNCTIKISNCCSFQSILLSLSVGLKGKNASSLKRIKNVQGSRTIMASKSQK